jgi:hypothetical protein
MAGLIYETNTMDFSSVAMLANYRRTSEDIGCSAVSSISESAVVPRPVPARPNRKSRRAAKAASRSRGR